MDYPKPGSDEAVAQGCTCDRNQDNPNWLLVKPGCPIHDNFNYVMWQANQGKRSKK